MTQKTTEPIRRKIMSEYTLVDFKGSLKRKGLLLNCLLITAKNATLCWT